MDAIPAIVRLKKRVEFLAAARGPKDVRTGFVLQSIHRREREPVVGIGYTASKKVGGAVQRNRAKRRLREAWRLTAEGLAKPGTNYVLVARKRCLDLPFDRLRADLGAGLKRLSVGHRT